MLSRYPMLNLLWAGMIIAGVFFAAFTGQIPEITKAALDSSKEAVTLCITISGVMAFWTGTMEIAQEAGMIRKLSAKLLPFLHFLFPELPSSHKAIPHISTNIIANILGLGWAATPAGLNAMQALSDLEKERRSGKAPGPVLPPGTASKEMCNFLILNISSLQLIPVNIIAYRSQYGSVNPAAITGAGILATSASTLTAILYCKYKNHHPY